MSFAAKTLQGLGLIGGMTMNDVPFILTGHHDEILKCVAYQVITGELATSQEQLEDSRVLQAVEQLKNRLRREVQMFIDISIKEEQRKAYDDRLKRMRELHGSSKHGTVAEICERYKLSKSAVRRMRAENTLDAFIQSREMMSENA